MGRLVRVGVVGADESLLGIAGHRRGCLYSRPAGAATASGGRAWWSLDETSRGTVNQCCCPWRVGLDGSSVLAGLPKHGFRPNFF